MMKRIEVENTSYKTFQDILTGYRLPQIMMTAFRAGVFDAIKLTGTSGEDLCKITGWEEKAGCRFLNTLCSVGLLETKAGLYYLSPFSQKFLVRGSEHCKASSMEFEDRLLESWGLLDQTLVQGHRIYGVDSKNDGEYEKALDVYIGAMNDAACVRASELWDRVVVPAETGVILDAGAGSGAFLIEFLKRHPGWKGIFCDLKDVVNKARLNTEIKALQGRIEFLECNLLETTSRSKTFHKIKVDYVLFSNLVHCQGEKETLHIFSEVVEALSDEGTVIVHDFFSDCGWRGAMYDLHMLLNTFNGRTYKTTEITGMLQNFEMSFHKTVQLPSGSAFIAASKKTIGMS